MDKETLLLGEIVESKVGQRAALEGLDIQKLISALKLVGVEDKNIVFTTDFSANILVTRPTDKGLTKLYSYPTMLKQPWLDMFAHIEDLDPFSIRSALKEFNASIADTFHIEGSFFKEYSEQYYGLWLRFYRNSDWPCTGHPENLIEQPIGMHHCPVCGEMVVGGVMHGKPLDQIDLSEVTAK